MAPTQHVTWAELLPVIRKALPSETEFSDTVAHNVALAVSAYLLNRNTLPKSGLNTSGDFYEDDEPVEKIQAAFRAGPLRSTRARGQRGDGHGQGQRLATATGVASGHAADGHDDDPDDDAFAAAYRAAKVNAPVAVAKLTSVHYWADPGGRGRIRTEDGYESTWSGGHYEGAAKLAAEHGLRIQHVDNAGSTTWTRP